MARAGRGLERLGPRTVLPLYWASIRAGRAGSPLATEVATARDAQAEFPQDSLDQIMTRDILFVGPDVTVAAAVAAIADGDTGSVLVLDASGSLLGLFTERDLLVRVVAAGRDPGRTPITEVMTAEVLVLEATTPVVEAFRVVAERSFRHIPLSAGGRIVGMVSLRDLFRAQLRAAEAQLDQELDSLQEARHLLDLSTADREKELLRVNARLRDMALTDELTGLHNYRYFVSRLAAEVARAVRHDLPLSLLLFDLDHFKRVNDTYGHPAGDHVLRKLAELLKSGVHGDSVVVRIRKSDVIARYGGEEFAVLLPMTRAAGALVAAERSRYALEATRIHLDDGREVRVTVSVGVASCPEHAATDRDLLRAADQALYQAKQGGRNQVRIAERAPDAGAPGST